MPHTNDNVPMTSTRNKTNPTQEQRARILGKLKLGAETLVRPTTPAPNPSLLEERVQSSTLAVLLDVLECLDNHDQ